MMMLHLPTELRVRQPTSGFVRIPFVRRCRIMGPLGRQHGLVCDLSAGGAFVRLQGTLDPGARVQVSFEVFTGEAPIEAEADVMWQNAEPRRVAELPPGCGLRFVQLSPRDTARVAALVKAYSTLPS